MKRAPRFDVRAGDVPRDLFPAGRVRFSLGATGAEARRRRDRLNDLRTWGAWDILRAIQDGHLHVAEVCRRIRQDGERAIPELRRDLTAREIGLPPTLREEADRYLAWRSEEHTSELQSRGHLVCRLLLEKKKKLSTVQ